MSDRPDNFDGATAFLNPPSERSTENAEATSPTVPPEADAQGVETQSVEAQSIVASSVAEASIEAPTEADTEVDPLIGQILASRYRITRLLGTGGMGAVYRAEHIHMRKAVALKVLHREMTAMPEIVARFEREAVAAARIEHPNVATATDFGRLDDGAFYLVLEFVEGQSLSKALELAGTFSPLRAVHVTRQIADALAAAHGAGVVHRDLKPDNVMLVEREGDRDFAKVLDFGIAKVHSGDDANDAGPALTQAGSVFGTPSYMSPEQAKGDAVDARSDLYTLGMILYELLSGDTAFAAPELIAILTKTLTEEPPPLPESVPVPLRDLVMKLLRKEPAERVQSAEELARELFAIERALSPLAAAPMSSGMLSPPRSDAPVATSLADSARSVQLKALATFGRARSELVPLLKRRVALGKRDVPLWMIAAPATALGVILTVAVATAGGKKEAAAPGGIAEQAKRIATAVFDPTLANLMDKARGGDREALGELRKRAEKEGGASEWTALGRGYAEIRHYSASAEAYGRALKADGALAKDKTLLTDVFAAAEDRDGYEKALDLALSDLGETGADLVYAVYKKNSGEAGMTSVVAYAKKLTQKDEFEKHASEALKVAVELDRARVCSDYKELLPQAIEHADTRSEKKLKSLNGQRGCGFLGVMDCYPCLRSKDGTELKDAIDAAGKREAPEFASAKSEKKSDTDEK